MTKRSPRPKADAASPSADDQASPEIQVIPETLSLAFKEEELETIEGGPDEFHTQHVDVRFEALVALGAIALGVALFILAGGIRIGTIPDPITSRGFPYGVATVLVLGGLFALWRAYRRWKQAGSIWVPSDGSSDTQGHPAKLWRPAAVFGATVVWIVALPYLGFLVMTPLLIFALLEIMGVRSHLKVVVISLISTVVAFLVFYTLLRVYFPLGPLTGLFRQLHLIA